MDTMRKLMFPISEENMSTRSERLSTYQNFYVNTNEDTSTSTSVASHIPPQLYNSRFQRSSFCKAGLQHPSTAPRRLSEASRSIGRSRGRSSLVPNVSNYLRSSSSSYASFFDSRSRSYRSNYPRASTEYREESNLRRLSDTYIYPQSSTRKTGTTFVKSRGISSSKPQTQTYDSSESPNDVVVARKEEVTTTESYQELPDQKSNHDHSSNLRYLNRVLYPARNSYVSISRPEKNDGVRIRNHVVELTPVDSRNFESSRRPDGSSYRGVKFVIQEVVPPSMTSHFHRQSSPRISNPRITDYSEHPRPGPSGRSTSDFSHYSDGHRSHYSGGPHVPHSGHTQHGHDGGSYREAHHHQSRETRYHPSRRDPSAQDRHHSSGNAPNIMPRSHHHHHSHQIPSGKTKHSFVTHKLQFHPNPEGVKQSEIDRILGERRGESNEIHRSKAKAHRSDKSRKLVISRKKTGRKRHQR
ncbi:unnamed protein product [Allacma fusca]|uniref:Uncharacterized protein n=1 Tax=Allacma fusca TaxID=39272 RepID=A0A8J2PBQ1_9HEXA|nr:unnamed protein product [Allacma fusca]